MNRLQNRDFKGIQKKLDVCLFILNIRPYRSLEKALLPPGRVQTGIIAPKGYLFVYAGGAFAFEWLRQRRQRLLPNGNLTQLRQPSALGFSAASMGVGKVHRGFIDGCVHRRKHPFNGLSKRERGLRKEKGAFEKGLGPYIIEINKNSFSS